MIHLAKCGIMIEIPWPTAKQHAVCRVMRGGKCKKTHFVLSVDKNVIFCYTKLAY